MGAPWRSGIGGLTAHTNPPADDTPAWGDEYVAPGVLWTSEKQLREREKKGISLIRINKFFLKTLMDSAFRCLLL